MTYQCCFVNELQGIMGIPEHNRNISGLSVRARKKERCRKGPRSCDCLKPTHLLYRTCICNTQDQADFAPPDKLGTGAQVECGVGLHPLR